MPLRSWIKRLERSARGNLASFELLDGTRFYFYPLSGDLFLHWVACLQAGSAHNWPEPPEVIRKVCEAKDVRRALEEALGEGEWSVFVYDPEVIINERRLEPRGLVTRCDPQTGKHHVRDPYEDSCEDLSE
jgi:hypothetical protein